MVQRDNKEQRLSSTIHLDLYRAEARESVGLGTEIQVVTNVQEVRNLEPEETMRMSALRIQSYLKDHLGLLMGWELETILSLKENNSLP